MNVIESIFLGLLQGLTEFLPISSSAHLVFLQNIFGFKEPMLLFDVLLHFSTLMSIFVIFWDDIMNYLKNTKILVYIFLLTIPTGIIGLIIKKFFVFTFSSVTFSALCLLVTGTLLFISENVYRQNKNEKQKIVSLGWKKILLLGIAQGIAVFPGISRSGATLSTALMLNLNKEEGIKFIFIASIPAIIGATMIELRDSFLGVEKFEFSYFPGMVIAFISGLVALKFLISVVKKLHLRYFSYYCWTIAAGVILYKIFFV